MSPTVMAIRPTAWARPWGAPRGAQVAHALPDRADGVDEARGGRRRRQRQQHAQGEGEVQTRTGRESRAHQPRRSRRWSPTLSALAMIVSAGFTAALDGKKLA